MSKSLKKLIDINRLREFKNKLVGTGSAYVQTGAVDQTIAGTKTFSKPIAGSVTGSSGSCTGNAATATTATTAKACTGNAATATQFSANATVALTGDATGTSAGSKKGWSVPVTLANSGVTAGSYGPSADVTGNNNATISVPQITVDAKGRVTSVTNRTLTCKNNTYNVYNKTLTIQKNGTNVATFTSNSNTDVTANITVPTKTSELTNDSGFLTSHQSLSNYVTLNGAQTISGAKTFSKPIAGSVTGSSGSCTGNAATATTATTAEACTGNAATATKLATARTIALSGAATGTATDFDGSGNITIPVTALSGSAITSAITIYDLVPDGAASHRNFYRGKDLTAAFNDGTVSANIANGTFRDIFPGDYITKRITVPQILKADGTTEYIAQTAYNVRFVIADLDVWLNRGDTSTTAHHVAIVPERVVFNSCMNETNTTEGGYFNSYMNKTVMPAFGEALRNAFGSEHIPDFSFLCTDEVDSSLRPGGVVDYTGAVNYHGHLWAKQCCYIMLESMVYGAPYTASSATDEFMGGVHFAAFRLNSNLVYIRQNYWLSDVVSSTYFALVTVRGNAGPGNASGTIGVRPFALLI